MKIRYSTRIIILIGSKAYKFPVSRRGWLQGKNEAQVWKDYKHTQMLAPLLWERWGIVCQERCQPINGLSPSRKIKVKQIKRLIPQLDIDNCDLYNYKNWGKRNNRLVLLDYGIDETISKLYKTKEK